MDKILAGVAAVIGVIGLIVLISFLFAFPVMWLVNALFTPALLLAVFGTAKLSVGQAWILSLLSGILFKNYNR